MMKVYPMSAEPEFPRLLELDKIDRKGLELEISADKGECVALARRFGILAVNSLSASLRIRKSTDGGIITVRGRFLARTQQECSVLLDPFEVEISADIDQTLVRAGSCQSEVEVDLQDAEAYDDEIDGNNIDLGEMTAQCLALELDPYPRKPGAEYVENPEITTESDMVSPFSELARLKQDEE